MQMMHVGLGDRIPGYSIGKLVPDQFTSIPLLEARRPVYFISKFSQIEYVRAIRTDGYSELS